MADTCAKILQEKFPSLDAELFSYVNDVLENGAEDFQDADDIYDAVGSVLHEVCGGENEEEVMEVCQQFMNALRLEGLTENNELITQLSKPVHLASMTDPVTERHTEMQSIWLRKSEDFSVVDQKKLEKAEAKIRQKQEKKALKETDQKTNGGSIEGLLSQASTSQSVSKRDMKIDNSGGKTMDIKIENFDLSFGERVLLKEAEMNLACSRRYGLVGRNGLGKTTLLKAISRRDLHVPSHLSILHVEQEVVGDDTLAVDSVLESDELRTRLLKEEKELSSSMQVGSPTGAATSPTTGESTSQRLAEIYAKLEEIDADKAPARASTILNGLGFTPTMQGMRTREFSGGWRMRLALARALFSRPNLLLLDEPTNMLDIKAILWLEDYLQNWPTTMIIVSHDRNFLDSVATDIIHLHSQRLDQYKGNYETFLKSKTEKLKNQQREYEAQQQYREHAQAFIDKFRYNAKRASLVQSKIKALEKLPELKPIIKEPESILKFPDCESLSPPILQLCEVRYYYTPEKVIFDKIDISADMESRIALVGENGTGKTTMLKILLGELSPIHGLRNVHRNLKIGYFSQHHVDQLTMDQTPVALLASRFPGKNAEAYRHQLGSYGISGELALRPVASLSGGQKSRLAFAVMCMTNPNFLILDEPTNHLDMETIEALGKALGKFKGGVVLVSHDERLIRSVCKEVWVCGEGKVRRIEGGFDEYRRILEEEFQKLS